MGFNADCAGYTCTISAHSSGGLGGDFIYHYLNLDTGKSAQINGTLAVVDCGHYMVNYTDAFGCHGESSVDTMAPGLIVNFSPSSIL